MSLSRPSSFTILVEGNIGSGKTTFLQHFTKFPQVNIVHEPIDKWRDLKGENLFRLMYSDPAKWSLCFQSYVQLTMLNLHTRPSTTPFMMMERSIYSAKYCFVNNLKDQGFLAPAEYSVLTEWFDFIKDNIPIKVDLIVYLRTDPEVVYNRIANRGRSEEKTVSLSYLKNIHDLHEDWLYGNKYPVPAPVLTIDANEDLSKMTKNYTKCEDHIFSAVSAMAN